MAHRHGGQSRQDRHIGKSDFGVPERLGIPELPHVRQFGRLGETPKPQLVRDVSRPELPEKSCRRHRAMGSPG